ncbi:MAG: PQQ-dependent sugar dehydrogenase [Acidobacteriota bacterium]|nr:PQQ-dependent sugar dehydrogenase [Acidobacteriota bacterium]MDQ3419413.1 PQQ-dependent sugar dehydrogenase [Acidobacteriota bacterium]
MRLSRVAVFSTVISSLAVAGCSTPVSGQGSGAAAQASKPAGAGCTPIETREASVPEQRPAFPGQTRVCEAKSTVAFDVTVVTTGLVKPWSIEPLPDGSLLVTEKPGRLRIVSAAGELGPAITGLPEVDARGQGGLLDVELSPAFATDQTIFWSFSEPREGGNATSVARGVLSKDRTGLEQVRVIFRAQPTYRGTLHYGSRLAFGPDKMLYVTLGDRSDKVMRPQAQQLDSHMGKILRITPEGSAPPDNPFVGKAGTPPEIWTVGQRNVQSADFDSQGRLWQVEHGAKGGDELNLVKKGANYGWPLVAYGEEYSGDPIPNAVTVKEGFEQPVYYWDPVIAPSGAEFYTGSAFPAWRGNLFVGALREKRLVRLVIENDKVTGEEHLLTDRDKRIRDVKQGPDGALYVVTDEQAGEVWKIAPKK